MNTDRHLAPAEVQKLADLEAVVDRGLNTFVEVGNALREIREARLYRHTHATFDAYCKERFTFTASRGRQLILAAKTVTDVTLAGLSAPRTEGEARRLARELRQTAPLEQWPTVRGVLPDITGEEWRGFTESLRQPGLLNPILLYKGWILDGWQRYRACLETGTEPTYEFYEGDESARPLGVGEPEARELHRGSTRRDRHRPRRRVRGGGATGRPESLSARRSPRPPPVWRKDDCANRLRLLRCLGSRACRTLLERE